MKKKNYDDKDSTTSPLRKFTVINYISLLFLCLLLIFFTSNIDANLHSLETYVSSQVEKNTMYNSTLVSLNDASQKQLKSIKSRIDEYISRQQQLERKDFGREIIQNEPQPSRRTIRSLPPTVASSDIQSPKITKDSVISLLKKRAASLEGLDEIIVLPEDKASEIFAQRRCIDSLLLYILIDNSIDTINPIAEPIESTLSALFTFSDTDHPVAIKSDRNYFTAPVYYRYYDKTYAKQVVNILDLQASEKNISSMHYVKDQYGGIVLAYINHEDLPDYALYQVMSKMYQSLADVGVDSLAGLSSPILMSSKNSGRKKVATLQGSQVCSATTYAVASGLAATPPHR